MISVKVHEANNIPICKDKLRKTIISCFSYSSYRYFYGTYKSKDKSTNPHWNFEFNVNLFKLIHLRFFLYGVGSNNNNYFIGSITFNFVELISNSPENQILSNPGTSFQKEFQIKSSKTSDSKLTLSFTYIPISYQPIKFKPSFFNDQMLHVYVTFSPSYNQNDIPVEIELLQASSLPNEKSAKKLGFYYNLNKETSWESVGRSSLDRCFLGPTGPSQIHTLSIPKISGKFTFFILNVSNFTGKVSLTFLYEKCGKIVHFADRSFIKTKAKNQKICLLNSIDVDVQPNMKYLVPYYLFIDSNSMNSSKYQFNRFLENSDRITYDKSRNMNNPFIGYSDKVSSEIYFHSQIIDKAHSISSIEKINFLRTILFTHNEPISLTKTLRDYNLPINSSLRFYVGGATTNVVGDNAYIDYWHQNFIAYDKNTGQICPKITKMIENQLIQQTSEKKPKSFLPSRIIWNSAMQLNMDKIETDKILVYYVYCYSYLQSAFPNGFVLISQYENGSETLLFRNPIFSDYWSAHFAICFRIEFIQNEWKMIPMRQYFETEKEMISALKYMKSNNWSLPQVIETQKITSSSNAKPKSKDDYIAKNVENNNV